jgi:plastocyanin
MNRRISKVVGLMAGLQILCGSAVLFAKPVTHTVTIENMKFNPAELTVSKGDTVVWENKDLVPHTVTAEDGKFDSKMIVAGKHWKLRIKQDGTLAYHCLYHPTMAASLVVKPASANP